MIESIVASLTKFAVKESSQIAKFVTEEVIHGDMISQMLDGRLDEITQATQSMESKGRDISFGMGLRDNGLGLSHTRFPENGTYSEFWNGPNSYEQNPEKYFDAFKNTETPYASFNEVKNIESLEAEYISKALENEKLPSAFDKSFRQNDTYSMLERNPSKFYTDIMERFLADKDKFSPITWDFMSVEERSLLMKEAYQIFGEELCLSPEKLAQTQISYEVVKGANAAYFFVPESINETASSLNIAYEGISVDPSALETGNFFEAMNSLYHETLHQFQIDMLENPGRYPVESIRQDWFESVKDNIANSGQGDRLSYYSDSMEMFAHQNADYFTKTYEDVWTSELYNELLGIGV